MAEPLEALYEEDYCKIKAIIQRLQVQSRARLVALIGKNGHELAVAGETSGLDTFSLASLAAGNVAATDSLARLLGEREFSVLYHQGKHGNIHISLVARRAILVVVFTSRSSLGLVRLRVMQASAELEQVLKATEARFEKEVGTAERKSGPLTSPLAEITEDDIEALFRNLR